MLHDTKGKTHAVKGTYDGLFHNDLCSAKSKTTFQIQLAHSYHIFMVVCVTRENINVVKKCVDRKLHARAPSLAFVYIVGSCVFNPPLFNQVVAFGLFLIDGPANKSRGEKKGPSSRLLKMNDRSLSIQRFDRLFKVSLMLTLTQCEPFIGSQSNREHLYSGS